MISLNRPEHMKHGVAQVFSSVGSQHNQAASLGPFQQMRWYIPAFTVELEMRR